MEFMDLRPWVLVVHMLGMIMWIGSMIGCSHILAAHANADGGHKAFEDLEKNLGIAMDVGATLSIASGLYLALGGPANWFVKDEVGGAFMHGKVGLVVLGLIAINVLLRIKIKKFRNGDIKPFPKLVFPMLMVVVIAILILIFKRPF